MVKTNKLKMFLLVLLASCSSVNKRVPSSIRSCTNPIIINGVSTDDFNSSVKIRFKKNSGPDSFCTGTIVSRKSILTAAHCIQGSIFRIEGSNNQKYENFRYRALKNENYRNEESLVNYLRHLDMNFKKNDSALILFEDIKFPEYLVAKINISKVFPGEPVFLVGYGNDGSFFSRSKGKRFGTNKIYKVGEKSAVIAIKGLKKNKKESKSFFGEESPDGEEASVDSGDSGGALYDQCRNIIGINAAGYSKYYFGERISYITPVFKDSENWRFLEKMNREHNLNFKIVNE